MGIYNALFTGASGLSSFGEAVRVIGDNIANVNSLGFKSQNVVFSDVLSQTVNVSRSNIANQVGNGVRIGQITRDGQQGSIQSTTNATDMAINGRGMFALKDPASGQTFFTRAGAFFLDKSFNLIDGQGFVVQGWKTDTTGAATGNVRDITFANLAAQASATTKVDIGVSIDSNAVKPSAIFNPNDAATYNYKTDVNVFDSLGATHSISMYFVKQGLDASGQTAWDWHAAVAGNQLKGATSSTPTTPVEIGGGIYDVNTPSIPQSTVLPINAVLSSDVITDKTITIPKGAIVDQNGTTNIAPVTWAAGTALASELSKAASGSLSASGLFTLTTAITPSTIKSTVLSAGQIYMPGQPSINNATTTISNNVLPAALYAKNSANGIAVVTNGVGSTLSADALTALGSSSITFPAGSLQDDHGVINSKAITWTANTKLATSVIGANATMSATGQYTLVGTGDILMGSSPVAVTAAALTLGSTLPTLKVGATLTAATALTGGVTPTNDLVFAAGSLKDSAGTVSTGAITLLGDGTGNALGVAAAATGGLLATGPYTVVTAISNAPGVRTVAGTVPSPFTVPTSLLVAGSTLTDTVKLSGTAGTHDLLFPIGSLKDSAGTANTVAITLPAAPSGGVALNTLTVAAGLLATGPYTLTGTPLPTANGGGAYAGASTLVAGTFGYNALGASKVAAATVTNPISISTTLNTGATLTDTSVLGGASPTNDLVIPAGSMRDSLGATNTAAITLQGGGAALGTLTAAAGLSATGPYTLIASVSNSKSSTLVTGAISNPQAAFSAVAIAGAGGGAPLPAILAKGAILSDTATVNVANLVIPSGGLKDSAGVTNTGIITMPLAGTSTLGTLAALDGGTISGTGPYTLTAAITGVTSMLTAGTVTQGTALPATLNVATSLDGAMKVSNADLVIPIGALKDSAGKLNTAAITLPAAGGQLDSLTVAAGLSGTGPYSLFQQLTTGPSTIVAGTATLKTELAAGLVSIPPISALATTGIAGVGPQSIVFDANGALVSEFSPQLTLPWNGANANQITMNMGSATTLDAQGTSGGKGLDGVVQLAGSFATRQMTRDGFTSGFLDKLETDSTGVVFGVFTNGQRRPLFQVALANFPNAQVLSHMGSNLQQETIASGTPVMEKPGNGGMGSISPFGLEQSNVDLAAEFVKLIIVQRGYEANSKTITTTDQMLGSLMQLKR